MRFRTHVLAMALAAAVPAAAQQQQDFSQVEIKAEKVTEGVYMLTGRGGNIGLSVGKSGSFLVDDQYAPLTDKILAVVKSVSPEPVRFLVNTHWHGDHTGGNENIGKAGVFIVAHENVRQRMSKEQFKAVFKSTTPPSPEAALPVVTFGEGVTFHWNGDEIRVYHVPPAHTDGDSIVVFRKANVVHMGDLFFNGMYPFIDVSS
ncbi:MAG: MBL fold metallo-hydrolase, partial [Vicinamibacterales bacterium]